MLGASKQANVHIGDAEQIVMWMWMCSSPSLPHSTTGLIGFLKVYEYTRPDTDPAGLASLVHIDLIIVITWPETAFEGVRLHAESGRCVRETERGIERDSSL